MFFLKLFWSLVQWIFLFAVGLWLYFTVSGDVKFAWAEYSISMSAGLASALAFGLLIIIVFFTHMMGDLIRLPSDIARRMRDNKRSKGHQTLLRALSAASAGDYKNAYYLAHRAQKFLPEQEQGMSLLLQAHAAKSQGKDIQANDAFEALVKHPDTSVLGVQGLLQKRVLDGDVRGALELARAQSKAHSKNKHLLRPVYDLEKRNGLWNDALLTLEQLLKANVISKQDAAIDRAVLWIAIGDLAIDSTETTLKAYQKAYHSAPHFAPTILRLARIHLKKGQRIRAVSIAKRAIEKDFHPSLVGLWAELKPADKDLRWFTWLIDHTPLNVESFLALANRAIELSLWGEAKAALMKAEKIESSKSVYRLWVRLEETQNASQSIIRQWLDRLEKAPESKGWVCVKTLQSFDDYKPVIEPQNLFNTLEWTTITKAKMPVNKGETALLLN
jgi:uncharacterized membrane-anchored protein